MATQASVADRGIFSRGLRLIGSYIRMHPLPFFLSVGGAFLYAVGTIGSTVVLGRVTNAVLVPAFHGGVPESKVWLAAGAILGVAAVRSLGIGVRRYFSGMSGEKVMQSMRLRGRRALQGAPDGLSPREAHRRADGAHGGGRRRRGRRPVSRCRSPPA